MLESIKEIIKCLKDNTSGTICAACLAAMGVIYSDARAFIAAQQQALQEINKNQSMIAVELREINTRLATLEQQQKGGNQ